MKRLHSNDQSFKMISIQVNNVLAWLSGAPESLLYMKGRTVLIIAHRLSTVRNADTIIVLDHGEVIEKGTDKKLLGEKGCYYNLTMGMVNSTKNYN